MPNRLIINIVAYSHRVYRIDCERKSKKKNNRGGYSAASLLLSGEAKELPKAGARLPPATTKPDRKLTFVRAKTTVHYRGDASGSHEDHILHRTQIRHLTELKGFPDPGGTVYTKGV